jgi:hypothetical protein
VTEPLNVLLFSTFTVFILKLASLFVLKRGCMPVFVLR